MADMSIPVTWKEATISEIDLTCDEKLYEECGEFGEPGDVELTKNGNTSGDCLAIPLFHATEIYDEWGNFEDSGPSLSELAFTMDEHLRKHKISLIPTPEDHKPAY